VSVAKYQCITSKNPAVCVFLTKIPPNPAVRVFRWRSGSRLKGLNLAAKATAAVIKYGWTSSFRESAAQFCTAPLAF